MTSLRTTNHKAKRAERRRVRIEAYAYDMTRVERLSAIGRLDKRIRSGFVRRMIARSKANRIAQGVL